MPTGQSVLNTEAPLGQGDDRAAVTCAGPHLSVPDDSRPRGKRWNVVVRQSAKRWGLVLAGGEGLRLRSLTRSISGDDRPKQFCQLFGEETLLAQTLERVSGQISQERLLVSLAQQHERFYCGEEALPESQRLVQPTNRGTAPPIAHACLSIAMKDPEALVAVLPCDHFYADEASFKITLDGAFDAAARHPTSVVLVGAHPDCPEVEYGWIELGNALRHGQVFPVRRFVEKPSIDSARELLARGAVWNTFVMVAKVRAFLQMLREAAPDLMLQMGRSRLWTGSEVKLEKPLYCEIPDVAFCRDVLSTEFARALCVRLNSDWSDLGDPGRALLAARRKGFELRYADVTSPFGAIKSASKPFGARDTQRRPRTENP